MQTLNITKLSRLSNLDVKNKFNFNHTQVITIGVLIASLFFLPEVSFAAGGNADAFETIFTKASGWVGGSAGKLITFISLAMAGIMGVAGFPTKYVVGALGTGLLLSSANGIVEMMF